MTEKEIIVTKGGKLDSKDVRREAKPWVSRMYVPGNETQIIELFEKVFGKSMASTGSALAHWQWEYANNPVNESVILLAWAEDGRLVGQNVASPLVLFVDGVPRFSALSHDTMTDLEYQGQGIFTKMAKELFLILSQKNYHSIFGFPNGNSVYGWTKKLGWRRICTPPVYLKVINPECILSEKFKIPAKLAQLIGCIFKKFTMGFEKIAAGFFRGTISIHSEDIFGDWADTLWGRCCNQHRVWTVRNKSYLNWRYVDRPDTQYEIYSAWSGQEIVGYVVTCRENMDVGNVTFVMDMMVDKKGALAAHMLLHKIVTIACERNDVLVSAIVMPSSKSKTAFLKHLFMMLPERFFPQELYFAGLEFSSKEANDFFYDPKSWGLSWGDDDVI